MMVSLPFLEFKIPQCKECYHLKTLIVVEVGPFVATGKYTILKGSQIFAFEKHARNFLFDSVLTPLFENSP